MSTFVLSMLEFCSQTFLAACLTSSTELRTVLPADQVTPLLCDLHWLPVGAHIEFKIAMLCCVVDHGLAPICLSLCCYTSLSGEFALLTHYTPHIRLETFGRHSFSFSGPNIWNGLPPSLHTVESVHAFRYGLKTSLSEITTVTSLSCCPFSPPISAFLHVIFLTGTCWLMYVVLANP